MYKYTASVRIHLYPFTNYACLYTHLELEQLGVKQTYREVLA
jgi:hypothetical protein